jgi:AcrR family transcriptional regulator
MPMRPRNARGEGHRLRSELVAAATQLLLVPSPTGSFSLRAVAKEAGVAAPSIYIHFADREELLLAVIEGLFAEFMALREAEEARVIEAGGGPRERLLADSLAYLKFGLERPGHYRALYEGHPVLRHPDLTLIKFSRLIQSRSAELIEEAATENHIDLALKPERLALLLWSNLHGIVSLQINRPTLKWPAARNLAKDVVDTFFPVRRPNMARNN